MTPAKLQACADNCPTDYFDFELDVAKNHCTELVHVLVLGSRE